MPARGFAELVIAFKRIDGSTPASQSRHAAGTAGPIARLNGPHLTGRPDAKPSPNQPIQTQIQAPAREFATSGAEGGIAYIKGYDKNNQHIYHHFYSTAKHTPVS